MFQETWERAYRKARSKMVDIIEHDMVKIEDFAKTKHIEFSGMKHQIINKADDSFVECLGISDWTYDFDNIRCQYKEGNATSMFRLWEKNDIPETTADSIWQAYFKIWWDTCKKFFINLILVVDYFNTKYKLNNDVTDIKILEGQKVDLVEVLIDATKIHQGGIYIKGIPEILLEDNFNISYGINQGFRQFIIVKSNRSSRQWWDKDSLKEGGSLYDQTGLLKDMDGLLKFIDPAFHWM